MIQSNALFIPLKDKSVQMCCTSPPYWSLRDYSVNGQLGLEATPEEFIENCVKWAREVWRVLRTDGTFWLNLGDSYAHSNSQRRTPAEQKREVERDAGKGYTAAWQTGTRAGYRDRAVLDIPPGLKPKDLCGIPWKVAFALQADGWWLRSAMPWVKRCLSGGTMIHAWTQKGIMPTNLKDLYRLKPETVKLWNGKQWTQLKGMTKQPRKGNEIEIFLRSGERISCTPEHRWPVVALDELMVDGLKYANQLKVGDVLKRCKPASPDNLPVNYLPSHSIGRFIGLYIAEERRFFLRNIADMYDGTIQIQDREGNGQNINMSGRTLFGILDDYVAGKGAHGKHLTTKSWQRGNIFLRAVLEGYLEGDGHYDKKNTRWRLGFCNNDAWVSDLRSICARLGVSLRLKRTVHKNQTGEFKGYKGDIRFDLSDKSVNSGNFKKLSDNEIVKIGKPRARYYYDVEVEDEPHLFSLASGILTHNSAMPESCTDRPASALEYMFLLTKSSKYYFDMTAIRKKKVDMYAINPYIDTYENIYRKTKSRQTKSDPEVQREREGKSEKKRVRAVGSGKDFIQQMAEVGKGESLHSQVQKDGEKKSGSDEIHQDGEILQDTKEISNVPEGERVNLEGCTQKTGESGELHKHIDSGGVGTNKGTAKSSVRDLQRKEKTDKGSHSTNKQGRSSREEKHSSSLQSMQYTEGEQSINYGRNFRNTDLFYQSLEKPHGAIFCGDEMVGLDVNPQAFKDAHFATFPDKLASICIKAGSSERGCCPKCKSPWERVVEKEKSSDSTYATRGKTRTEGAGPEEKYDYNTGFKADGKSKTIGWQPTCKCGHKETVPCIILDPFAGSFTTKSVAERLGRRGIGLELKWEYIQMGKKRCRIDQGDMFLK